MATAFPDPSWHKKVNTYLMVRVITNLSFIKKAQNVICLGVLPNTNLPGNSLLYLDLSYEDKNIVNFLAA